MSVFARMTQPRVFVFLVGISTLTAASVSAEENGRSDGFPQPLTQQIAVEKPQDCVPAKTDGCATPTTPDSCYSKGCCGDERTLSIFGDGCCADRKFAGLGALNDLMGDNGSGIKIGGWSQWGYHSKNNTLFNKHKDNLNLHQQWFYIEKVADGSNGLDWGFRADMMYGVDAADTQSFGNNPGRWDFANGLDHGIYGWAFPQLYGEIASGDLSVKFGHFYTLIGYEVVTAPDNFFYSHAYTMFNSEPFTHTGVLATYNAGNDVTVYAGWTTGWDTGFDRFNGGSSFLGGFSVPVGEDVTFTYITTIGDFGWRGEGYSHSLLMDIKLTEKLNYIVQSDLVNTNLGGDHQYGLNQYLLYAINDCLGIGMRAEWWKSGGNSQYEVTWGVNVKPYKNFIMRPEVRHDWNPGTGRDFTTLGVDFILTF